MDKDLENIIEGLMSSPDSIGKIMDVMKMFGNNDMEQTTKEEKTAPALSLPDIGGFDSDMVSKVMELIRDYNADGDRRIRLLGAIRPYLKTEDGIHIDRAIQIVKLSHVAKGVLKNFLK